MSSQQPDLERGPESSTQPTASYDVTPEPFVQTEAVRESPVIQRPAAAPRYVSTLSLAPNPTLNLFRAHLGIHNIPELDASDVRPVANVGIYKRVVVAEKVAHRQYQIFSCLINGALGLQIIFAAALTALGAGNGPHTAVTAFGAMNTILAGLLTFLKGSGLPNRLKFYENEWTKVREYIEQRERDFATNDHRFLHLDLLQEISIIEKMYENVRKDIEANTPDSYISLNHGTKGMDPPPSLARHIQDYNDQTRGKLGDMQSGALARFTGVEQDLEKRVIDTQHIAEQGITDTQKQAQMRMRETQLSVQGKIADTQAQAAARVKDIEEKVMMAAEKAAEKVLQLTKHRHEGH